MSKRFLPVKVAPQTSEIVRRIVEEMNVREISVAELCRTTGMDRGAFHRWQKATYSPNLHSLEKTLSVLGLQLIVVPRQ